MGANAAVMGNIVVATGQKGADQFHDARRHRWINTEPWNYVSKCLNICIPDRVMHKIYLAVLLIRRLNDINKETHQGLREAE
jgi:hypothetical protein